MTRKDDKGSAEELVQDFLKKNKNFFLKHPELLKELQFPLKDESSNKVIDLQVYRYKKINQENIDLQNQMTQILLAGKSHMQSQKRILKSSLKILNSKSLAKVFSVILSDSLSLRGNCNSFSSSGCFRKKFLFFLRKF